MTAGELHKHDCGCVIRFEATGDGRLKAVYDNMCAACAERWNQFLQALR